jgi:beta-glucosidase
VTLPLDYRSFAHWDTSVHDWRVDPGCYAVAVGRSSRDLPLRAAVALGGAPCPGAVASIPIVTPTSGRAGTSPVCLKRRSVLIRLSGVRRSQVRRIDVLIDGRRQRTLRGHRSSVRVTLPRRTQGVIRVRLVIRLGHRRRVALTKVYRCAAQHPKQPARSKPRRVRHRHQPAAAGRVHRP